jgi:heme-degrading monooxygenase HmoA
MVYLMFRGKVKDYEKWKPVFDGLAPIRKEYGAKGGYLYRTADNPNELVVVMEWESVEKARKWAQSEYVKKAFEQGGVIGKPEDSFSILEVIEKVPV